MPWIDARVYSAGFVASEQPIALPGWLLDMDNHTEMCLTDRYPQRWGTETLADSGVAQSWPQHYGHLWCRGLWACVCTCAESDNFKHTTWTRSLWPYMTCLCDWLAQILYTEYFALDTLHFIVKNIWETCFVSDSAATQLMWGGRLYSRYVCWLFVIVVVKSCQNWSTETKYIFTINVVYFVVVFWGGE